MNSALHRHRRWTVPALAVAVVLSLGAVPNLFPASGAVPRLPSLSPAQLLIKAHGAKVTALSGTVRLTSRLGIPSLGSLVPSRGNSVTLTSLLAGTHEVNLSINGPDHVRIVQQAPLAETVWVRNGTDLWAWDSVSQRATHAVAPAGKQAADKVAEKASTAARASQDPTVLAQELLAHITPSTTVSVRSPRYLAGQAVYELVLTPKTAVSTIKDIVISVDSITGLPLDVKITARGAKSAALELGFTKINYATPPASDFVFTPPPGSTVVQAQSPQGLLSPGAPDLGRDQGPAPAPDASVQLAAAPSRVTTVGKDWASVAIISGDGAIRGVLGLVRNAPEIAVGTVHGRLIGTALLSVLVLDDGRIAVGAVTPAALQAAVASLPA